MASPATSGQEGPSYAPPPLPEGWIAQWDGWDTPTQAAPTVSTPTATPAHETSLFAHPGQQQHTGERGVDSPQGGPDGERGLGQMAMNQLLHSQGGGHSGKQSNPLLGLAGQLIGGGKQHQSGNSSNSGLLGMAGQLIGGPKPHQSGHSSNTGPAGLVGALAGSFLGGAKPNQQHSQGQHPQGPQQSYSGQQPQGAYGQHGGVMGKLSGMLGGSSSGHQGNYGYSEVAQHQGGYTGQAPTYQPGGGGGSNTQPLSQYYNQQPPSQPQNAAASAAPSANSYQGQQPQQATTYGSTPQQQQPPYGHPSSGQNQGSSSYYGQQQGQQPPYGSASVQQPAYGVPPQQSIYGASQQPSTYGAPSQQQPSYGAPPPPTQQPPYGSPVYGSQPSGNLEQQQHHLFQGLHNASHHGGLYGDGSTHGGAPPLPSGSHPNHGQQGSYASPGQGNGGYSEMPGSTRW